MTKKPLARAFPMILAIFACLSLSFAGCKSESDDGPSHSYQDSDVQAATSAWAAAQAQAETSGAASGSAWVETIGTTTIFHISGYQTKGITVSGAITVAEDAAGTSDSFSGSLSFTGTSVSSLTMNYQMIVATRTYAGTETFTFTDGTSWTYNLATGAFSEN